ncbi:MalY/PatB family protein [Chromobacterium alticapitis]|uniref:Putative 8-amino-7-oxononanoate synthase n=1 Tax=Chromobacterium alticapitis TaxID=2073169 RepID=A0A2S5DFR7_9NEIS|nr:PatB family C-S lyase [Chromobacterium alticapitis]POZ61953.1 aspartate aminotransferase [Chromobacterium alticapitis]
MDFHRPPDRRGTASEKWDKYAGRDILPMWVADMDFAAAPAILDALRRRIDHGVFGYTHAPDSLVDATQQHLQDRYGWTVEADWLTWLPGLVPALSLACRAVGEPGDAVLTATPIYPPFLKAPALAGRALATAPLALLDGRWRWDWQAMENAAAGAKLLLLSHPHNPTGRCWDEAELAELIAFSKRRGLIVCSDEIHCDLLLGTRRHQPLAAVDPDFAARTITLMSPSKTWNLAGLGCAFAIIPDTGLRRRFRHEMSHRVPPPGALGYVAAEAAYREGEPWRQALLAVLRDNRDAIVQALAGGRLPLIPPQATYLAWFDARAVHPERPMPAFERAGVGLADGRDFGAPGWLRLNFGCPPATLEAALRRMRPLL